MKSSRQLQLRRCEKWELCTLRRSNQYRQEHTVSDATLGGYEGLGEKSLRDTVMIPRVKGLASADLRELSGM